MNPFSAFFDIAIVAFFIYAILTLLQRTRSIHIFRGILTLVFIYLLATYLHLELTVTLFRIIFPFFSIIIVIVFQREFRRFFEGFSISFIRNFFAGKARPEYERLIQAITEAVAYFQEKRIGALLVFPGLAPLEQHIEGGYVLDGRVSTPLLVSIFDPSSPGHDGAVVIDDGKVARFGVHLPLAEQIRKVKDHGTRHRAGLGLTERADAMVVIVSEEQGTVSIAEHGAITKISAEELGPRIASFYKTVHNTGERMAFSKFLVFNLRERALAILIAVLLWFVVLPH